MMRKFVFTAALAVGACSLMPAQDMPMAHGSMQAGKDGKPIPSPRANASIAMGGTEIKVGYGAPSLRGRKMVGGKDPYGKPWRLGANEATSFVVSGGDVMVGSKLVPAGSYTLFVLPTADKWTLIISKKTGEWGIPYPGEADDFARVDMTRVPMQQPVETMSISFEKGTGTSSQMHVKWDTDHYYVAIRKK